MSLIYVKFAVNLSTQSGDDSRGVLLKACYARILIVLSLCRRAQDSETAVRS